jgi:iron(III) transport system ATP-binding protein
MVFQSYAIWPHMTVFDNVAYPLRVRRAKRDDIRERVLRALRLVEMENYADRPAPALSGGQQQRVAIARALVFEPALLLLDEPLSNLDARLRAQMGSEFRALQKRLGITSLYVTHDQEEAMAISDRIAIMNAGQIVQIGTAEDLYLRPAARFVATFLGDANLIEGKVIDTGMDRLTLDVGGFRWDIATSQRYPVGSSVSAVVRPEDMALSDAVGGLKGTILSSTYLGAKIEYLVRVGEQNLQVVQPNPARHSRFAEGAAVGVALPHAYVHLLKDV